MAKFRAVICGGGIAAVEGLLRLRKLAGHSIDITIVAPNEELILRPLSVLQPIAGGPPSHYPLKRIAADNDAAWLKDGLGWVDPDGQIVHTEDGQQVPFDALLIAVGARQHSPFDHVQTFRDAEADQAFQGVVQDIEEGYSKSIAFLAPEGASYPLPLYELALMTAERAYSMGMDLEVTVVTPEDRPLSAFGSKAGEAGAALLIRARITVYSGARAKVPAAGRLVIDPLGVELHPQRMLAIPSLTGPAIRGLHAGAKGFLPIGEFCRVPVDGDRVYAAGDAAEFPIKHGGLGAQMADSAASAIAALAVDAIEPEPFRPVIRGKLLGGKDPLFISARLVGGGSFESEIYEKPPWREGEKVVSNELGSYLADLDAKAARARAKTG
jgi:sulfide:quinone oxidoreductase